MFSVAPTLGNEKAISAPCRRSAVACSSPWANLNEAPIASRPATCMSIGRAPKSSPPGIDRRTSPQRVSSGPSTLIEARIRSTSSYGASGTRSPSFVQDQPTRLRAVRAHAEGGEQLAHDRHVVDRRDVGELVATVGEEARRHQLEHGVLRPGHADRPLQRTEVADRDLVRRWSGDGRSQAAATDPPVCSGRDGPRTRVVWSPVRGRPGAPPPSTSCRHATTSSANAPTATAGSSRSPVRSSSTSAWSATTLMARRSRSARPIGTTCRGSAGCSPCRSAGRSPAVATTRRAIARQPTAPRRGRRPTG